MVMQQAYVLCGSVDQTQSTGDENTGRDGSHELCGPNTHATLSQIPLEKVRNEILTARVY